MSNDREQKSRREQWRSPLGVLVIIIIGLIVAALLMCAFLWFWVTAGVEGGSDADQGLIPIIVLSLTAEL